MSYGIIIHYGLYSYYAYDDVSSAKKRKIQNGAEWYYGRLIDNNKFRPISGHHSTKQYHNETFNNINYFSNLNKITKDKSKIKKWINVAKTNGASYIILTAKHHDGVCLFNTNTTDKKSEMDICKFFSEECIKENIAFGFYYSWFEFDIPMTCNYFQRYCIPQVEQLLSYNPNYMWFDGDWTITQKSVQNEIKYIVENTKLKNILVNDRIGKNNIDIANYRVFSDRYIPTIPITNTLWQHVNTIGLSWGYNSMQSPNDYKTLKKFFNYILKW